MKELNKVSVAENTLLEKVIERAEYHGAMAYGDLTHLHIEDGLKRLCTALNILKFKDPNHP